MTNPTATTTMGPRRALPNGRYSIVDLLRSEWTKIRTVRSTVWTIGITLVLAFGLSALACSLTTSHWSSMDLGQKLTFDATQTSLIGVFFGEFVVGILGVLVMSAEYGTGTIRATLAASPRRPMVLIAKALVFGLITLVISEISSFGAYFLGQALLQSPATHTTLSDPGAFRAVFGAGLFLCVLGLFALGLAAIIRHTAGAISAYVGILLVLPIITAALPSSIGDDIREYLPSHLGETLTAQLSPGQSFSPWGGFALLCGYALLTLILGVVQLCRKDA